MLCVCEQGMLRRDCTDVWAGLSQSTNVLCAVPVHDTGILIVFLMVLIVFEGSSIILQVST